MGDDGGIGKGVKETRVERERGGWRQYPSNVVMMVVHGLALDHWH